MSMDALTSAVLDSLHQALLGPLQEHLKTLSKMPPEDRQASPELNNLLQECIHSLQTLQDWSHVTSQLEEVAGDLAAEVQDLLGAALPGSDSIDEKSELEALDSLLPDFRESVSDLLDQMMHDLEGWQTDTGNLHYKSQLLRVMHTIKGTAGMFQLDRIAEIAHTSESVLMRLSGNESAEKYQEVISLLYRVHDHLRAAIAQGSPQLDQHDEIIAEMTKVEHATVLPQSRDDRVRVAPLQIDNVLDLAAEIAVDQHRLTESIRKHLAKLPRNLRPSNVEPILHAIASRVKLLQNAALELRMVPLSDTLHQCRPVARDVERQTGKKIELDIAGAETLLDRKVVSHITEPLIHLIRNACDHGIEGREIRLANGKPPTGRVSIRATEEANSIKIIVQDDGKGLDLQQIKETALHQGLIQPDQTLTTRQTQDLIFTPGFSTAGELTRISGRGVGMDIVKQKLAEVNGAISIETFKGRGTKVEINVPSTLAIARTLHVKVANEDYVIPAEALERTIRIRADQLDELGHYSVTTFQGRPLPVVRLRDVVDAETSEQDGEFLYMVILMRKDFRFGLIVDQLISNIDLITKPFGPLFGETKCTSGSTLLPNGNLALMLDPANIYQAHISGERR